MSWPPSANRLLLPSKTTIIRRGKILTPCPSFTISDSRTADRTKHSPGRPWPLNDRSNITRERVGSDVVRLNQRGVKQLAQRNFIAGLKPDVVFLGPSKRRRRNNHGLV